MIIRFQGDALEDEAGGSMQFAEYQADVVVTLDNFLSHLFVSTMVRNQDVQTGSRPSRLVFKTAKGKAT